MSMVPITKFAPGLLMITNGTPSRFDISAVRMRISTSGEPPAADYVRLFLDTLPLSFAGEIVLDADCGAVPRASGPSSSARSRPL